MNYVYYFNVLPMACQYMSYMYVCMVHIYVIHRSSKVSKVDILCLRDCFHEGRRTISHSLYLKGVDLPNLPDGNSELNLQYTSIHSYALVIYFVYDSIMYVYMRKHPFVVLYYI